MDKVKFVMGEISTLAVDLNAIAAELNRWEEERILLEFEYEEREKKRKAKDEELPPAARVGRPALSFDNELLNIRDRLNLLIDYLNQTRVSQFTTPWEGR